MTCWSLKKKAGVDNYSPVLAIPASDALLLSYSPTELPARVSCQSKPCSGTGKVHKAVFLDRDGTIARDIPYCSRPEDYLIDIGTPEKYNQANEDIRANKLRISLLEVQ